MHNFYKNTYAVCVKYKLHGKLIRSYIGITFKVLKYLAAAKKSEVKYFLPWKTVLLKESKVIFNC